LSGWRNSLRIVKAGDRYCLEPQGISALLDMEESSAQCRPPTNHQDSHLDPQHESHQSSLGAPRIHGELLKLGIDIGETTVAK
jgi:hypothetical protein